jgi:hypothetical protein
MSLLPEEAQEIADLRAKILANQAAGLPPHAGLDKDVVKRAVELSRKEYTAAQSKSKAAGVSNPSNAPAIDLSSLFTSTKSG